MTMSNIVSVNLSQSLPRITLVLASAGFGGLEKHVIELATGLANQGYPVTLISDKTYSEHLTQPRFDFVGIDFERSRNNPKLLWDLYQAIKSAKPDMLHVHGNKSAQLISHLNRIGAFKKLAIVGSLHSQKSNTKMFAVCDAVIAVSNVAKQAIGDKHANVQVILNGIQLPQPLPRSDNPTPIVLTVGRLERVKGYDVLIKAWQEIDAILWIVGEGSLRAEYEALIAQQLHPERIKLLGFRKDINELMHQADLFVMSSHYEGCPYVMIEALLTNTPMVSTRVGAMVDILPSQYLAKINDSQDLHDKIMQALRSKNQTEKDYAGTFAWAKAHLTFDKMLEQIIAVYQSVWRG